jgi:hypothetical protein
VDYELTDRLCQGWRGLLPRTPFFLQTLILWFSGDRVLSIGSVLASVLLTLQTSLRTRATLQLEILALRHQLQVVSDPAANGSGARDPKIPEKIGSSSWIRISNPPVNSVLSVELLRVAACGFL